MADTGYNWDAAWAYVQESASDWDDDVLADDGIDTSDAIALDGKAGCLIGVGLKEDAAAAVTANSVTIAVLGETIDGYENILAVAAGGLGSPYQFTATPIISDTVFIQFSVNPANYSNFKICIMNESGNSIKVTVSIKYATIPVAS